jgi:hypothetical protein
VVVVSKSLVCSDQSRDVPGIAMLLAAYTHDLQMNVYARDQELLYRGKYR